MIGADEFPGAAGVAINDPRSAVAADVGEGPHRPVLAAHDDDAFSEKLQRMPLARLGDVAEVTDDLPARPHHALHLDPEEFGIVINPGGQAPGFVGIDVASSFDAQSLGHPASFCTIV